jgi:hypothetical protein
MKAAIRSDDKQYVRAPQQVGPEHLNKQRLATKKLDAAKKAKNKNNNKNQKSPKKLTAVEESIRAAAATAAATARADRGGQDRQLKTAQHILAGRAEKRQLLARLKRAGLRKD